MAFHTLKMANQAFATYNFSTMKKPLTLKTPYQRVPKGLMRKPYRERERGLVRGEWGKARRRWRGKQARRCK